MHKYTKQETHSRVESLCVCHEDLSQLSASIFFYSFNQSRIFFLGVMFVFLFFETDINMQLL